MKTKISFTLCCVMLHSGLVIRVGAQSTPGDTGRQGPADPQGTVGPDGPAKAKEKE